MAETPISEIIKSALEGVKQALDANTIIGEPMTVMEHTVIIPISKISCGIATGGSDFGKGTDGTKKSFRSSFGIVVHRVGLNVETWYSRLIFYDLRNALEISSVEIRQR